MVMSLETHGDGDHLLNHCCFCQLVMYYLSFLPMVQLLDSSLPSDVQLGIPGNRGNIPFGYKYLGGSRHPLI